MPDERAPLLGPQPSTVDTSNEVVNIPESQVAETKSRITPLRGTLCVISLGLLIFLQATNISLLTVAQSAIADELDAYERTSWFTSAYLIAMSSTSPLNGKLSQILTPRISIFAASLILALGALVTAAATDFAGFIAGRVLTGVGAAGIFTVSIIIVLELSSAKRRGLFIGLLNSGFTIGVAAGATIAGALLPSLGWRALFWLQAPIAVVGGTLMFIFIPDDFTPGDGGSKTDSMLSRLAKLDYVGATGLTATIVLLLYALSSPSSIPVLPIILSLITLTAFVIHETLNATDPIIPVSLLKSRGLLLTCLGTVGFMMSRWTVLFYTPTYAIAVRDWSPTAAGSMLIPTNGGFAVGGLLVGWLHIKRKGSFYLASLVIFVIFPITLLLLSRLSTTSSPPVLFILVVFVNGAASGAALNYSLAHLLHITPTNTHYIATSLLATFRGFAGSFGSAVGAGLFTRVLRESLEAHFKAAGMKGQQGLIRRLLGSPALVGKLTGVEKMVAVSGYEDALGRLWLSAAGLAAIMVLVQAGVGWKGVNHDAEDGKKVASNGDDS